MTPKHFGVVDLAAVAKARFDAQSWGDYGDNAWSSLQLHLAQWEQKLYGVQPFERKALGVVEELAEFKVATDPVERLDAISDATIFSKQLCTTYRLDFGTLVTHTHREASDPPKMLFPGEPDFWPIVRMLNQITLKTLQGTRGLGMVGERWAASRALLAKTLSDLAWLLDDTCAHMQVDYFSVVKSTAEKVMQRTKDLPSIT